MGHGRRGLGSRPAVVAAVALALAGPAACSDADETLSFCETVQAMNTQGGVGFDISSDDPDADAAVQLRESIDRARGVNDALRRSAPADIAADAALMADRSDAVLDRLEAEATDDADPFDLLGLLIDDGDVGADGDVTTAMRRVSAAAERECGESLRAVDALDAADRAAAEAERRAEEIVEPTLPPLPPLPDLPTVPSSPEPTVSG